MRAVTTTPEEGFGAFGVASRTPSAFPVVVAGRLPHWPYRGLLGVHCTLRPTRPLTPLKGAVSESASDHSSPPDPPPVLPAGTPFAGRDFHPRILHALTRHTQQRGRTRPARPRRRPQELLRLRGRVERPPGGHALQPLPDDRPGRSEPAPVADRLPRRLRRGRRQGPRRRRKVPPLEPLRRAEARLGRRPETAGDRQLVNASGEGFSRSPFAAAPIARPRHRSGVQPTDDGGRTSKNATVHRGWVRRMLTIIRTQTLGLQAFAVNRADRIRTCDFLVPKRRVIPHRWRLKAMIF